MKSCARCGAELRPSDAEGFCVRCLLESGLEEAMEEPKIHGAGPTQAQLAEIGAQASNLEPGAIRRFGDYVLLEEISRGGMGVVYRALQVSLGRIVAVKMLLAGPLATKDFVQRFRTEAAAAASLQHPNIVAIHEVGFAEGQHFFAMDYVEGLTLAQLVAKGPLPARQAAIYLRTIAGAIDFAHERNVLHRDLKPSNILIDSATDQPRVTDFGLAKRLEAESELTLSGQVLGSPNFISPEQATAKRGTVGKRSDVYSLGANLYHLLTGRPPFQGETLTDVLHQVMNDDPLAPHLLTPRVPHDLETICLKCLEKEPSARYQTAQELAAELSRFLRDEPILARPINQFEKTWRWCRRNPKTASLSAAVCLLLITVAIGSTLAAIRITRAELATTEKLFEVYVAHADAVRRNGGEGQRFTSMEAVTKAAAIRSSLELRSEAIACLAVTDFRFRDRHSSPGYEYELWDPNLERRAYIEHGGRLRVRSVADNKEFLLPANVGEGIAGLHALSPGGRYIAFKRQDGRSVVWDVDRSEERITNLLEAVSATFSVDGQVVLASCQDGMLRRFALDPVQELPSLAINRAYHFIRVSPHADWFAGYEEEAVSLEVRDLNNGLVLETLAHPTRVGSLACSGDGVHLAVGCFGGQICIWNALTGGKEREFQGHQDAVTSLGFSHSGSLLGSCGWDGHFKLWDLTAERLLLTAAGYSYQIEFSEDDRRIGYLERGEETGALEIMASSIFHRLKCRPSPNRGSLSIDVSADGRLKAATFAEGVRIWADQQTENPFVLPEPACYSVLFTPEGTHLITSGQSGLARWPIHRNSGKAVDELRIGPRQAIKDELVFNYAALSTDGRLVAAALPAAAAVSIYEVGAPSNQFALVSQPGVAFPAISPDGRWVAAGNWKGSGVKVWEFGSQRLIRELPTPFTAWATFSGDGRWLATSGASYDLWETWSWKRKHTIRATHPGTLLPLAFSPDSRTLAVVAEPAIVRLIAVETGEVLADLEAPHGAIIWFLRFSPDGSRLFALEWDQQVQVWDLRRMRAELGRLNLDWSAPPIAPPKASAGVGSNPLHIVLE